MTLEQTIAVTEIMNTETVLSMRDAVVLDGRSFVILDLGDGRTIEIDADGAKNWCLNGKFHRTDGPAIEWVDGTKYWYLNGLRHRADGPAIEWADGTRSWCLNGKFHRTDGPAIERANGTKYWFLNGQIRRKDGPVTECLLS